VTDRPLDVVRQALHHLASYVKGGKQIIEPAEAALDEAEELYEQATVDTERYVTAGMRAKLEAAEARVAQLQAEVEALRRDLRQRTDAAFNFKDKAEAAKARVAQLEQALREYAHPSSWGRVMTAAGNRETVFLCVNEPWAIAREALEKRGES
jgi:predicted RNase H-like nuclease (RuvC/YqgF family)